MENRIELNVSKTITRLAGNNYGAQVCKEQILPNIDLVKKNIIIIPSNIKGVAISFVEGILKEMPKEVTKKTFYNFFIIDGDDRVIEKFRKVIAANN